MRGNIKFFDIERDEMANPTDQLGLHAFLRADLNGLTPKLGNLENREFKSATLLDFDMQEALKVIHGRIVHDERLTHIEIYSNGFNVFGEKLGSEVSFGVWSYRRDVQAQPKSILEVRRNGNNGNRGRQGKTGGSA